MYVLSYIYIIQYEEEDISVKISNFLHIMEIITDFETLSNSKTHRLKICNILIHTYVLIMHVGMYVLLM